MHLGCVDHLPLLEAKRARGEWLHARLCRSAARCLGIDIHAEGVEYLRNELHIRDVVCADLTRDDVPALREAEWDLLVVAEMLEHTDDPVAFLRGLRKHCFGGVRELALTAPNAFRLDGIRDSLRGFETINSDHRYWFTPFTLGKVLVRAGWEPLDFQFVQGRPWSGSRVGSLPRRLLCRRFPTLRDTLVMTAGVGAEP